MAYKVGLIEEARNDLGAAARFIAVEGANPEAGLRLGNELLDAALAIMPRRGRRCGGVPHAETLSPHWLIFYPINEAAQWVEVVRI